MHSLCGHCLLLSRPLRPQAVSLHPVPADRGVARLLQSQTVALYFLLADVVVSGHLLPQTIPTDLLASQPRVLPLSSIRLRGSRPCHYSYEALIAKKLTRRLNRRREIPPIPPCGAPSGLRLRLNEIPRTLPLDLPRWPG